MIHRTPNVEDFVLRSWSRKTDITLLAKTLEKIGQYPVPAGSKTDPAVLSRQLEFHTVTFVEFEAGRVDHVIVGQGGLAKATRETEGKRREPAGNSD